jgi:DNA helicase HerA-like ATPase
MMKVSKDFSINLEDYAKVGERDAILASSGMGKSYLTGVIAEETLQAKELLVVIDPQGEYYTLAEKYPILVIGGKGREVERIPFDPASIPDYVKALLNQGASTIFDFSGLIGRQQLEAYTGILTTLFNEESGRETKRILRLIVDEAQLFAPQSGGSEALNISAQIAKQGRKEGLNSLFATQRPASINKDILSQCNRIWFGGITAEQDYKAIKPFLQEAGITADQIRALTPGDFILYSQGRIQPLRTRERYCRHGGSTPAIDRNAPIANKQDIRRIMEGFK